MQTLLHALVARVLSARVILFFCAVLTLALVYNQPVYAWNSVAELLLFETRTNEKPISLSVYPSDTFVLSGTQSSTSFVVTHSANVYDVSIPVSLHLNTPYSSNSNYALSGHFVPNIKIKCPVALSYCGASYECDGQSTVFCGLPLSGTFIPASTATDFYIQMRLFDLPARFDYTSVIYVHFYFQATHNQGQPVWLNFDLSCTNLFSLNDANLSADNSTVGKLQDIQDTIDDNRDEDRNDAGQAGDDATDLVANLDSTIKSRWEILWYPLDFTKSLLGVFTGSTARSYIDQGIVGYTYNERDGTLDPVIDYSRAAVRAVQGTTITFPGFSMLGMQIWDSYDYDLASVKSDFPAVFDALYVVISVLEVYWFVGFLRSKYDEVFG